MSDLLRMWRPVVGLLLAATVVSPAGHRAAIAAQVISRDTDAIRVGDERSIVKHMQDGTEFATDTAALLEHGRRLFAANWTAEDGGGRPSTKGTGRPLAGA